MRKAALASILVLAGLALAASAVGGPTAAVQSGKCAKANLRLVNEGRLTIGTDNPAYPPWFGGGTKKGSDWELNDPSTGKGFESAVAYAVARQLGFRPSEVQWTYVPFNRSFAPGPKPFDFDINQISYTPARAKVVSFSASYYDVNQAIVVLANKPIARVRSIRGLRSYKLGAATGSTSYDYIVSRIKPTQKPSVLSNAGAVQQLKNGQIDGLVVDLPTAFYVTAVQVDGSKILGQFPTPRGGEHFGMVFAKGNPLVGCVNRALATLRRNGTLARLQQRWLARVAGVPVLK